MMRSPLLATGLAVLLSLGALPAQATNDLPAAPAVRKAPAALLQAFHVSEGRFQHLSVPRGLPGTFAVRADFAGAVRTLDLHAHDVRSAGFKLLAAGEDTIRELEAPPSVTYRGTVRGAGGSRVAASLADGRLSAMIALDDNTVWVIQPANDVDASYPATAHLAWDNARTLPIPGVRCGAGGWIAPIGNAGGSVGPAALKEAETAIDADHDYYLKKGSNTTRVNNDVTSVINAVNVIYRRDVEIVHKITAIIVRTSRVYSGSIQTRLNAFRNRWNSLHGNIKRDMAHLFTGEGSFSGVIGVAWLGVVCTSYGYGASKAFHSSLGVNAGLVAHEKGHNWGSGHCSGSDCRIMCPGLGGCARDITRFGQFAKNAILSHKNSRSCLSDPGPPVLTGVSPSSIEAFGGSLKLSGTRLGGVTEINAGNVKVSKFTIVSDSEITFDSPDPVALGVTPITVRNASGLSNGVNVTYVATNPPKLGVSPIGFVNFPLGFRYGAQPGAIALMLWNADGRTARIFGADLLVPIILLPVGALDSVGLGTLSFTPDNSLKGLRLWSQVATFNGLNWGGATPVLSTLFL